VFVTSRQALVKLCVPRMGEPRQPWRHGSHVMTNSRELHANFRRVPSKVNLLLYIYYIWIYIYIYNTISITIINNNVIQLTMILHTQICMYIYIRRSQLANFDKTKNCWHSLRSPLQHLPCVRAAAQLRACDWKSLSLAFTWQGARVKNLFFPHPEQHLWGLITFGNRMYRIQPVNNLALCRMLSPCSMLSWMWTTCWRTWSFEDVWGVLRVHLETMDHFNKDIGELL
jgi:hypothetical protein